MICSDASRNVFIELTDSFRTNSSLDFDQWIDSVTAALPPASDVLELEAPAEALRPVIAETVAAPVAASAETVSRVIVASLSLNLVSNLPNKGLPQSILTQYPDHFDRLADWLSEPKPGYGPGDDSFLKDVRIAGGYSVPCGAQDVDLNGAIRRTAGLKAVARLKGVRSGARILWSGGPHWFRIHTDSRFTDEFNESGWERCYRRIADLLVTRPDVKGMAGTSWFYDPQIMRVSPRLGYLQRTPLGAGAFLLWNGPGAVHTQRATATSATRRSLVEEGTYLPVCYTLVWPRDSLIGWAREG